MASKKDSLKLKGQQAFKQQIESAGGTYATQQVADLLGVKPDAIRKRGNIGQLIAIPQGDDFAYPTFQFDDQGLVKQIPELLDLLQVASPVDAIQFFLIPNKDLGCAPIDALKRGENLDLVFRQAKQFGRQVAR